MARKLGIGDVARLKSGGPWMTVTKDKPEVGTKFVGMSWFDGSALNSDIIFPKDALELDPTRQAADEAAKGDAKVDAKAD